MEIPYSELLRAIQKLAPEELEKLLEQLRVMREKQGRSILDNIPVLDVGPWPDNLSLRRKDMYGNDER